jgi:hypothetical protein
MAVLPVGTFGLCVGSLKQTPLSVRRGFNSRKTILEPPANKCVCSIPFVLLGHNNAL